MMGYTVKEGTKKGSKVILRRQKYPKRVIDLDNATQEDLKFLFETLNHPFVVKSKK